MKNILSSYILQSRLSHKETWRPIEKLSDSHEVTTPISSSSGDFDKVKKNSLWNTCNASGNTQESLET